MPHGRRRGPSCSTATPLVIAMLFFPHAASAEEGGSKVPDILIGVGIGLVVGFGIVWALIHFEFVEPTRSKPMPSRRRSEHGTIQSTVLTTKAIHDTGSTFMTYNDAITIGHKNDDVITLGHTRTIPPPPPPLPRSPSIPEIDSMPIMEDWPELDSVVSPVTTDTAPPPTSYSLQLSPNGAAAAAGDYTDSERSGYHL
ncbi:hypothetical protein AC1031_020847 [Aphanomyces cochlioides]|nr:hypothetical protein AC1031_020847 [Aphanomyces cochlioides]